MFAFLRCSPPSLFFSWMCKKVIMTWNSVWVEAWRLYQQEIVIVIRAVEKLDMATDFFDCSRNVPGLILFQTVSTLVCLQNHFMNTQPSKPAVRVLLSARTLFCCLLNVRVTIWYSNLLHPCFPVLVLAVYSFDMLTSMSVYYEAGLLFLWTCWEFLLLLFDTHFYYLPVGGLYTVWLSYSLFLKSNFCVIPCKHVFWRDLLIYCVIIHTTCLICVTVVLMKGLWMNLIILYSGVCLQQRKAWSGLLCKKKESVWMEWNMYRKWEKCTDLFLLTGLQAQLPEVRNLENVAAMYCIIIICLSMQIVNDGSVSNLANRNRLHLFSMPYRL